MEMRVETYNETYNDRNHKYTINIPLALFKEATSKANKCGFENLSTYFRAILAREIRDGNLNINDIIGEKAIRKIEWQRRENNDIPRYSFVRIKINKVLDLFNPRQYTLFK